MWRGFLHQSAITVALLTTLAGLLFALLLAALTGLLILLARLLSGLLIALLRLATLARLVLVLLLVWIVHFCCSKGDIALQPLRALLPLHAYGADTADYEFIFLFSEPSRCCVEIIQLK